MNREMRKIKKASQRRAGRLSRGIREGRFQRSLSGATAAAAAVTTAEVLAEHYRASFGNKWMWSPLAITPPVVAAGLAGVFSERAARTWLPLAAGAYAASGLAGEYLHLRGVARRPGGWRLPISNLVMGPPAAAPGLLAMVGAMGLVAALLRRE